MADTERFVKIVFGGVDQTGRAFQSVADGLQSIESNIGRVTGPLANVSETILKTEAAMATLGAAFLGFSYNEAVKFQAASLDLQKVLSDSEGTVSQYTPQVRELSDTYGVASTSVLESAANFRQAGFDINESLRLTESSLQAVKISELDSAEASRLFIATLNGFQAPAAEVGRLLDVLNAVSNEYAASVGELGTGMAELAPIARMAGLSFEETAGVLTPIIEIFGSGSEAARAMKTALLRLSSDTKPVQVALQAIGVTQTDTNGALRQSGDILKDLAGVWPSLTSAQQSYYAAELVGIDQAARFSAALGNYEKVLQVTQTALSAAGSAQKELAIRMQAAEEVINRTKVAFQGLAISVGAQFQSELTGVVDGAGELGRAFSALVDSGGLEPLFAGLRPLLAGLEDDLRTIAVALPDAFERLDFTPITDGFEAISEAVNAIFSGVDLTTADGLATALQKVVDVGGGMLQVTGGIIEGLSPLIDGLAAAATGFGDLDGNVQQSIGNLLGFAQGVGYLLPAIGGLGSSLDLIGGSLGVLAGTQAAKWLAGLSGGFEALSASVTRFAPAISGVIGYQVGDWFVKNTETGNRWKNSLSDLFSSIDRLITGEQAWEKMSYSAIDFQDKLADSTRDVSDAVQDAGRKLDLLNLSDITEQVKAHGLAWDDTKGYVLQAAHSEAEIEEILQRMYGTMDAGNAAVGELNGKLIETREEGGYIVKTFQDAAGAILVTSEKMREGTDAGSKFSRSLVESATSADDLSQKLGLSNTEATDFFLKLKAIDNEFNGKLIEANIRLKTAELEADTARFKDLFDSINTTITNTGGLIGDLFGSYGDAGRWEQLEIENQIDLENKRRDEALKKQGELADAEIALLKRKAEALARGDALLKIEADGMEPEIEAFMWRILEKIQVRANADAEEFLLNVAEAV
jgi:TP901 family phage tail tape measure protein